MKVINVSFSAINSRLRRLGVPKDVLVDWQYPVITEKQVAVNAVRIVADEKYSYLAVPWATLLDVHRCYLSEMSICDFLDGVLSSQVTDYGVTVCQSIHFRSILTWLAGRGVRHIFATHATTRDFASSLDNWGLEVHPFVHFPVNRARTRHERTVLLSFRGTEQTSMMRNAISALIGHDDCVIELTNEWHFQKTVFGDQLRLRQHVFSSKYQRTAIDKASTQFQDLLARSRYVLCPEGTGPNSIRLWEAICSGSIPVIVSEKLMLPSITDWSRVALFCSEDEIVNLPGRLNRIPEKLELEMRTNVSRLGRALVESTLTLPVSKALEQSSSLTSSNLSCVHLIQPFFEAECPKRQQELLECLDRNRHNPVFNRIHLLLEHSSAGQLERMKKTLPVDPGLVVVPWRTDMPRSISFNQIAEYANQNCLGATVVISNADIFFDESLNRLREVELRNRVLALTRWDVVPSLGRNGQLWRRRAWSQDAWVSLCPLRLLYQDVPLGWIASDNRIAAELARVGYQVRNPSDSIKPWHIHDRSRGDATDWERFTIHDGGKSEFVEIETIESLFAMPGSAPVGGIVEQILNDSNLWLTN